MRETPFNGTNLITIRTQLRYYYDDMRFAMRRYAYCSSELGPYKESNLTETDYLVNTMEAFLDEANLENEQLLNVSALMDNICRTAPSENADLNYPISLNIDVNKYSNSTNKPNRCAAIDDIFASMYPVFKRAAYNKSEPLDFSVIKFYPDSKNKAAYYNLTDLINTSWIKSETVLENVCRITDSVKAHVNLLVAKSSPQKRAENQKSVGFFMSIFNYFDALLEPIFGLSRRASWISAEFYERSTNRAKSTFNSATSAVNSGLKKTTSSITGLFRSSANSTSKAANSTHHATPFNQTRGPVTPMVLNKANSNSPVPQRNQNVASPKPNAETAMPAGPFNKTVARR